MNNITTSLSRDLRDEHNMACPACGHAEILSVEISCTASLSIDGAEAHGDHFWDDSSCYSSDACGHNGAVAEFRISPTDAVTS